MTKRCEEMEGKLFKVLNLYMSEFSEIQNNG